MKKIVYTSFYCLIFSSLFFSCAAKPQTVKPENYSEKAEIVSTDKGKVQGIYNSDKTVELFAGIPYAKPPVNELRWKAPQDPEPWNGILEADHFAPEAMQTHSKFFTIVWDKYYHTPKYRTENCPMSEDCLYLNIWKPVTENSNLPVLFYIHGGSFTGGQSFFPEYDGETLAKKGIVVVSIAYRVNVFGFLALDELADEDPDHSTGNYGLMDMVKSLEWVHRNISKFGGDPSCVTIAGESAGSSAISAMCASPLTENYIKRAIGESSSLVVPNPRHSIRSLSDAKEMGKQIMKEFKCSSIEELREIPAEKLVKTKFINNACTIEGYVLPESPYELYKKGLNHEESLLNGFNLHESVAWVSFMNVKKSNYDKFLQQAFPENWSKVKLLYPAETSKEARDNYTSAFTTVCFAYPHFCWSNIVAEQNKPVYKYCFTKSNGMYEAQHTGEIMYAYGNLPPDSEYLEESDYKLEEIMNNYWANFIKTGNPNSSELPEWKTYSSGSKTLLELGEEIKPADDPFYNFYEYCE